MTTALTIGFLGIYALVTAHRTQRSMEPMNKSVHNRLQKLWSEAHKDIQNKQWLRAERALLTILKFDRKDASAYNRLGIIYAKQKDYADAIKCFEIAKSIKPGASNYHNLGLLYLETENYEKAQVAFEEAISFDSDTAMRYIALAKVYSRTEKYRNAIEVLLKAVNLEDSSKNYALLAEAYKAEGNSEDASKYFQLHKKQLEKERAADLKSGMDTKKQKVRRASRAKTGVAKRRTVRTSARLQRRVTKNSRE